MYVYTLTTVPCTDAIYYGCHCVQNAFKEFLLTQLMCDYLSAKRYLPNFELEINWKGLNFRANGHFSVLSSLPPR